MLHIQSCYIGLDVCIICLGVFKIVSQSMLMRNTILQFALQIQATAIKFWNI